ncbi:fumarylacetoacetate hydrolase family protein [Motilimonas eburnea]|uniref:fumarylacetoacetate hydrolase family protein n=1 Tax=Motilimonas eburnea TaxID=1737488 RepID=UPI001E588284|nr:fumarylacetoacetate hydrolase family protein [Motilimonas eburnea]MCE2570142.1 fumarylacetoacetate hydrolase family protein [Motilimonas eburnea]
MKLASLNDGSRYGRLVVVSQDLRRAKFVGILAPNLPAALDDWDSVSPLLHMIYHELNQGPIAGSFELMLGQCIAPLAYAFEHYLALNYRPYIDLVNAACQPTLAPEPVPLLALPSCQQHNASAEISIPDATTLDFSAYLSVICGPVSQQASQQECEQKIRLLALHNQIYSPQNLVDELNSGWGINQGFHQLISAPVLVTPEELGEAWQESMMNLSVITKFNGKPFAALNPWQDAHSDFATILTQLVSSRALSAGAMLSIGPIMNQAQLSGPANLWSKAQLAKEQGDFVGLRSGDKLETYVQDAAGRNLFGRINVVVN